MTVPLPLPDDARETYEVLRDTFEGVRDRWTMTVCTACGGRLNEATAHPAWPKCECAAK